MNQRKRGRTRQESGDHPTLQRVKTLLGLEYQRDICAAIRGDQSTLSRALKAGRGVPDDYLYRVAYLRRPVRFEWLKSGAEPMYDEAPTIASYGPLFEALAQHWQTLTPTEQLLLWRLARLVAPFAPLWVELVTVLEQARPPTPAERPTLPAYLQAASGEAQPEDFPPIDDDHPY